MNSKKVIAFYNAYTEDDRSSLSRAEGLEFHYTKKLLGEFINAQSKVIEIGCATGYYGIYFSNKCAHYTGVDLVQGNIDVFDRKIAEAGITNITTIVGDATDLSDISGNSCDVVLCLGPMYHLPHGDRLKVFDECIRIAKDGAVLAFAYINRLGAYMGACVNDPWRETYPNARANKNVFERSHDLFDLGTGDDGPGVFHYTSPEEMEIDAKQKKLEVIKNCGLDFFFAQSAINKMRDDQFECYMEIADRMSESPSCTGLSDHALLICRK